MYYENSMKITLKNKATVTAALELLKARLYNGFDCDKTYAKNPSMQMMNNLELSGKSIVLAEETSCFTPEDAQSVFVELLNVLAKNLPETFSAKIFNSSDYSESEIVAKCNINELNIKTTYYPNGFVETLCCDECGMDIVSIEDYEAGKTYICPDCGEMIDLSKEYKENKPVINEFVITIR